jgi:hypothetical protein
MSEKNDRLILGGLAAAGTVAIFLLSITVSLGTFIYAGQQDASFWPGATTPGTFIPLPVGPGPESGSPLQITNVRSDHAARSCIINLGLAPGSAPADMRTVTVTAVVAGQHYPVWTLTDGRFEWNGNDGDLYLDSGETFSITFDLAEAGVPMTDSPLRLVIETSGRPTLEQDIAAV